MFVIFIINNKIIIHSTNCSPPHLHFGLLYFQPFQLLSAVPYFSYPRHSNPVWLTITPNLASLWSTLRESATCDDKFVNEKYWLILDSRAIVESSNTQRLLLLLPIVQLDLFAVHYQVLYHSFTFCVLISHLTCKFPSSTTGNTFV